MSPETPRVLVAGIGNVLRRDDGFGPAVIQSLEELPERAAGLQMRELGIGGINLVLELMSGYDALVIVDAIDRGGEPGALYILEPQVPEVAAIPVLEAWEWSSDSCQTLPHRALVMARAAGVLPSLVRIIGCQPGETDDLSTELSPTVAAAVPQAVQLILTFIDSLNGCQE